MIYSFQQITSVLDYLEKKQKELNTTIKYKLVKHLNHATSLYVFDEGNQFNIDLSQIVVPTPVGSPNPSGSLQITDTNVFPPIDIRKIDKDDYEEDKKYYDDFFGSSTSFEGVTRRLENAFGKYAPIKNNELPPIVSFYSYKGGVGRTTTLAALASYHARSKGAKVLILDCDFEAPGLINFFGMNESDWSEKSGIVEYLTDTSYLNDEKPVDMSQYIHTISAGASKDPLGYAGEKGTIYVMTAGNMGVKNIEDKTNTPKDLRSHQDHYLHGLARIDFSNSDYIVDRFQKLIRDAQAFYKPDVILIDSRTGFNDVFNNVVLRLSSIVVGVFGTSRQNIPGLYNFLDTISAENQHQGNALEVVLLNSIAPNFRQSYKNFKVQIEDYNKDTDNELNPEVWTISYDARMAEIGTPTDDGDILLDFTDSYRYAFPDYQNGKGERLLEYLSNKLEKKKALNSPFSEVTSENKTVSAKPAIEHSDSIQRLDFLKPLNEFFAKKGLANGEVITDDDEFLEKYYYFRNYLRDLFLKETFIVRGYKGTGKTLLYHALEKPAFVIQLKDFCNIIEDFRFVNIVDKFNVLHLSSLNFHRDNLNLGKGGNYYRRFWLVYIWNILRQNDNLKDFNFQIAPFKIYSDETTRKNLESLIASDKFLDIEFELRQINDYLKSKNIKIIISFDYLDKIVETSEWNAQGNPISELIKFAQFNPYSNLFPKIFIRTDLFAQIMGLNNSNALENKILSLDWNTEELFSYFFKVVHKTVGEKLINWLTLCNPRNPEYVLAIQKILEENNSQIPLEHKDKLEFLTESFFGEYIDEKNPNLGNTYSWFYTNLKNAYDVISLRPFIALLSYSFKDAIEKYADSDSSLSPILSGKFLSDPIARSYAAEMHIEEIIKDYNDKSNHLEDFLATLHESSDPKLAKYRYHSLTEEELRLLISRIFELKKLAEPDLEESEKLVKLLKNAGIIWQNTSKKASYSFPFLYKFYLRLQGNPQQGIKK
jgi:MinD-like ATPase involved in chromosome partitioning or flagellar assembly